MCDAITENILSQLSSVERRLRKVGHRQCKINRSVALIGTFVLGYAVSTTIKNAIRDYNISQINRRLEKLESSQESTKGE